MPYVPMMGSVHPGGTGASSVSITFPASTVFEITAGNLARAFAGATMSRACCGIRQGATLYAIDFLHEGSGANCTTWNTTFAGYTRGQVSLSAGTRTGIEVATAAQTALELLGVSGITRSGATLTIANASSLILGGPRTTTESACGMWGRQKVDCGTALVYSAVNATVSIHETTPSTAGRVVGVYISGSNGARSGSMRMGYATGPAYNVAPGAFSDGQEGLATRNGDVAVLLFAEPIAAPASSDRWIVYRTNAAAAWGVETRTHGSTPVGRGDLTLSERVLINTTITNPATAIFSAGAYTHVNSATGTAYAAVGLIYELPTAA